MGALCCTEELGAWRSLHESEKSCVLGARALLMKLVNLTSGEETMSEGTVSKVQEADLDGWSCCLNPKMPLLPLSGRAGTGCFMFCLVVPG